VKHPELLTGSKVIHLPDDPDHEYYIPGYILQKVGFAIFTGLIVALSLLDMVPKLWAMGFGEMTRAEVVAVIKTLPDETELLFTNDAEATAASDDQDYASKYHNILSFRLKSGETHEVRMPTGSRLSPPYDILDGSGLPTIVPIAYYPDNPDRIVLPARLGTWFFPVIIFLFGAAGGLVAVLYLIKATTPIQVPHLQAPPGHPGEENLAETKQDDEPDIDVKEKS
jgi:hypothetical protein